MKNMKKILVLALAALLLVAVSVAGTVAYLTATTDPVENTFTAESIEIVIREHGKDEKGEQTEVEKNSYRLLPGLVQDKDPFVRVTKGNCYVFIEVVGSAEPKLEDYIDWKSFVNQEWVEVENVEGPNDGIVYAYTDGNGKMKAVVQDDVTTSLISKIKVLESVDSQMMKVDSIGALALNFYGHALQAENVTADTPAKMWELYDNPTLSNP